MESKVGLSLFFLSACRTRCFCSSLSWRTCESWRTCWSKPSTATSFRANWTRGTSRWRWTAAWAVISAPTSSQTSSTRFRSGLYHLRVCTNLSFMPQLSVTLNPLQIFFFCPRCTGCEAVLCGIEEQVSRANQYRESQLKVKVQVETEVSQSPLLPAVSLFPSKK